ncbi:helix-turn-helix domain-containing protein [Eubacteriaceae bacterium ES3]|nr:helix-turn-helix domain-containing protein [Eubacteriaceae bacterium ES3]
MEKLTYTAKEIAELMGLALPKTYDLCNRADFPAIRVGRAIRVPIKEFEEWLSREARGENDRAI